MKSYIALGKLIAQLLLFCLPLLLLSINVHKNNNVCTFLNSMRVLMFCDRNSIAKKWKNFQHER